jgi:hypothetical protein
MGHSSLGALCIELLVVSNVALRAVTIEHNSLLAAAQGGLRYRLLGRLDDSHESAIGRRKR